jgi:hypothetical protein
MLRLGSAGLGYTVSLTGKSLLVWLAVKNLEGKQTRSGKATFVVDLSFVPEFPIIRL